jgi:hypothetical protein
MGKSLMVLPGLSPQLMTIGDMIRKGLVGNIVVKRLNF